MKIFVKHRPDRRYSHLTLKCNVSIRGLLCKLDAICNPNYESKDIYFAYNRNTFKFFDIKGRKHFRISNLILNIATNRVQTKFFSLAK